MNQAALRDTIVNLIEALIDVLDEMDGDPDFEPHTDFEEETDQSICPTTLNRDAA